MTDATPAVYTLGHSTRSIEDLIGLLHENEIDAIADVRSSPYSSRLPWFNRELLANSLDHEGVQYVFMGDTLGGRASGPGMTGPNGRVQYSKMAETESFRQGIVRVMDGSCRMRIALLCSEKDPLNCHRGLLVARSLAQEGVPIIHILGAGTTETQLQYEARLLDTVNMPPELTRTEAEVLADAYDKQASRVAYKAEAPGDEETEA